MIITTDYSFRKLMIFSLAVLGLCLWTGNSVAQSEHEKSEMGHERPLDKPVGDNLNDHVDTQMQDNQNSTPATVTSRKASPPKKENQVSGEGKKTETAPSTLSFNIFLYIVDKFKAD